MLAASLRDDGRGANRDVCATNWTPTADDASRAARRAMTRESHCWERWHFSN
jgi:hypothetical protein